MNASAPEPPAPKSGQRWPRGWTKLHVYLTELDEIKALAGSYRPVIEAVPDEVVVPHRWLHATVASIECDAAAIDDATRGRLVERLRERLGRQQSFGLTVGPALAAAGAIMLDTSPDAEFQRLVRACVETIDEVVEGGHGRPSGGPGHISLSYRPDAAGPDAERGAVQSRLRDVRPGRAEITVSGVDLVQVFQSEDASAYTWETIARIPLG